jgi:hypothetical protein
MMPFPKRRNPPFYRWSNRESSERILPARGGRRDKVWEAVRSDNCCLSRKDGTPTIGTAGKVRNVFYLLEVAVLILDLKAKNS